MSKLLDTIPNILPKVGSSKTSGLSVVGPLQKMAIIEEGQGQVARNASKLNLKDSIYTRIEE